MACGNDGQFRSLAGALRIPALAVDQRFATNPARVANRGLLTQALEDVLRTGTVDRWVTELTAAGVPVGPVADIAGAIERARELGLEPTVEVGPGHPAQIRHPITWSRSSMRTPSPPPDLGEHTETHRYPDSEHS